MIWNFEIFQNFQKNAKFSNQNRASGGLLEASWVSDLERGTSQLSLEKKIIPLSCLEKILGFVTYLPSKWVYPPIFRCAIFVVFSALFERKSKLQTKIQLRKASWSPPEFHIWKKQYHCFHWKEKILLSQFEKFKFCNVSFIRMRYGTDFQRCHICRIFSKIRRFQNFCVYKILILFKKRW